MFPVGIALDGAGWHPSAWRDGGAHPERVFTAAYWGAIAELAERAGLDYLTITDALALQEDPRAGFGAERAVPPHPVPGIPSGRLDAELIASWIAPRTERIGLIPAVTTTHTEPFHVATALQTLDHVSLGRAGWQLRISPGAAEAAALGRRPAPGIDPARVAAGEPDPALDALLDEAADAAEVARRLWDSWEDDAIIRDAETGRFLDAERLHHIRFTGEHFSVIGPSIVPRSPQGQLPVTLLAHSAPVYRLAARAADVVFVTPHPDPATNASPGARTAAQIVAEIREIEGGAARAGRGLAPLRIFADLLVALDGEAGPAGERPAAAAPETGPERIARLDALGIPLASDAHLAAGSASDITELIEHWREQGIEGVRLRPASNHLDLPAIAQRLLPELRRRGLGGATPGGGRGAGTTLRERFGLPAAQNRYASERRDTIPSTKERAA